MTVTDTAAWRDCRFCGVKIQPAPTGTYWIDVEGWDSCMGTEDSHDPVRPAAGCRVHDEILPWIDKDGNLNVHEGDLVLDEGEMCLVEHIKVDVAFVDDTPWIHVDLRDPRGVDTGLPVAHHDISSASLVAVRRYITKETDHA